MKATGCIKKQEAFARLELLSSNSSLVLIELQTATRQLIGPGPGTGQLRAFPFNRASTPGPCRMCRPLHDYRLDSGEIELELELIQSHMAQKPMLRGNQFHSRRNPFELELVQSHMAQKPVLRGDVGCALYLKWLTTVITCALCPAHNF